MRFKVSKTSLIITGGVAALVIVITVFVLVFIGGSKSKISGIKSVDSSGASNVVDPKIKESLDREKEILLAKGKYVGAADIANHPVQAAVKTEKKDDAEKLKNLEAEIFAPVTPKTLKPKADEKPIEIEKNKKQQAARQEWAGADNPDSDNKAREAEKAQKAAEQKIAEDKASRVNKQKENMWAKIYAGNAQSSGGFLAPAAKATAETQTGVQADMPHLNFLEPYSAVIEHGFTSGSKSAPFIAKSTQPGSIYGWKIMGTAVANMETERFDVTINGLLSPEGKKHSVTGYAASVDDSDGIVTAIKHEEIPGLIISTALAAASEFFKALRQDSSTTITTSIGTTTTPKTADNRLMEAEKAGLSSAFSESKALITPGIKKVPTLIVLKNTPILLYFNPQERATGSTAQTASGPSSKMFK